MAVSAFARRLPKVQLHCHLEGTVAASTFRELARGAGTEPDARAAVPTEAIYAFTTFREFLLLFAEVCKTLRRPVDYGRIARDYARDAVARRVRYAEIFVSPSVWTYFHPELDVAAAFDAIRAELDAVERAAGPRIELIVDVTRNFGPDRALATARTAIALRDRGIVAIGLGGDEAGYPAELFGEAFAAARAAGLRVVAHAGEAAGAASVRAAIEVLGAERIGHGIRCLEDPALVAEIAARGIPLEICPTSNYLTRAVAPDVAHPLAALLAAGVRCAIDADDPALFDTTVDAEYAFVERTLGREAALACAATAIDVSFASAARRAALRAELGAYRASAGDGE